MFDMYIGKVIEVSNTYISVAINKDIETPYLIINSNPKRVGGVGNFLKVENDIYEITNEKILLESDTHMISNNIESNRTVVCKVIGYFVGEEFKQGSSGETANIFDNVYTVSDVELLKIYSNTMVNNAICVGHYLYKKDLSFYIDIDKFFAGHCLIVGNTGSGKSNSVNAIFTELFSNINPNNSKFLFIDTNGEYSKAFTTNKKYKVLNTRDYGENEIKIPINLLDSDDWRLLLEATEKTQFPIIKSVWNGVRKNVFDNNISEAIARFILNELKKTIKGILNSNANITNKMGSINSIKEDFDFLYDSFYGDVKSLFNIFDDYSVNGGKFIYRNGSDVYNDRTQNICDEVDNYTVNVIKDTFTVEDMGFLINLAHLYRTYKYNINENNTSPLISRFNSKKKDFNKIFMPYSIDQQIDLTECLFEGKNVLVCDVSKAKKDIRRIIVTFLCSKLYNYIIDNNHSNSSLHLIIDEAHNYLSSQNIDKEDAIAKTCIETFESIIKEGRKFGVFLTMATQRPSDITSTLLSQSHNYVIHKLVNPRDIDIMRNTVPFIDEMSITMLSILAPGQAIFSGTAFNRPNIVQVKFDESISKVESDTMKLMRIWRRKSNFDTVSLEIAKKDVDDERKLKISEGKPTSIASDILECIYCNRRYVCINSNYAHEGLCFYCGKINTVIRCALCSVEIKTIKYSGNYEELICDDCNKNLLGV